MAHILVVDDETSLLTLMDTVLSRKGHEVVLAGGGHKGIEVFRQNHPDAVILDLNMPDLDGISVLKQIHMMDPHVPVIILTGAGTETSEIQAREAGVTEFLQKGFSLHNLGEALHRVLTQRRPAAASTPLAVLASGRSGLLCSTR